MIIIRKPQHKISSYKNYSNVNKYIYKIKTNGDY